MNLCEWINMQINLTQTFCLWLDLDLWKEKAKCLQGRETIHFLNYLCKHQILWKLLFRINWKYIYQSYLDNKVCVDKREKNDDEDDKDDNEIVPIKCFVFWDTYPPLSLAY